MALHEQQCRREVERLDTAAVSELLSQVDSDWQLADDGGAIRREIKRDDYSGTLALVNTIAGIADEQDHHPELCFGYNRCSITWSTHSVDGLSVNDFICAARVDKAVD